MSTKDDRRHLNFWASMFRSLIMQLVSKTVTVTGQKIYFPTFTSITDGNKNNVLLMDNYL
jgi:hypothetical protein